MSRKEEVVSAALDKFGVDAQISKCIEELDELKSAIKKYVECGDLARFHVAEEIADVHIMLMSITEGLGIQPIVEEWTDVKIERLAKMIDHEPRDVPPNLGYPWGEAGS